MSPLNKGHISIFKTPEGKTFGFHQLNLEVAQLENLNSQETQDELLEWSASQNTETLSGHLEQKVKQIILNVTQICNLHCTYCAAGGDGTYGDPVKTISVEKTLPQIRFFIEKLNPGETFYINFLGGEPLLYPKAIEAIFEYSNELAKSQQVFIHYAITSNGTLINNEIVSLLTKMNAGVVISLDGDKEQHDKNRKDKQGRGSFTAAAQGLSVLASAKNELSSLGISGTFNNENMDLVSAYQCFSQFDVDWFEFTFSYTETDSHASLEFADQLNQVAQLAFEKGGESELRKIRAFDALFDKLDKRQRTENFCGAGKSLLSIDARNNVYTCPWLVGKTDQSVGSGTSLNESKLAEFQPALTEKKGCKTCWARYLCGGGCMFINETKNKDKFKIDPDFCIRTRSLISQALMYYQMVRNPVKENPNEEGRSYEKH